jgi:hypothetical protein
MKHLKLLSSFIDSRYANRTKMIRGWGRATPGTASISNPLNQSMMAL